MCGKRNIKEGTLDRRLNIIIENVFYCVEFWTCVPSHKNIFGANKEVTLTRVQKHKEIEGNGRAIERFFTQFLGRELFYGLGTIEGKDG